VDPITVVIVDDHLLVADGLAAALDALDDITVLGIAGSCAEAAEAVAREQPRVLLLDQRLPDGLGTDALPRLLAACPTLKVLLMTADTSDEVMVKAIESGCAGFIRKGARTPELIVAVRSAANDEAVISAEDLRRIMPRLRHGHRPGDDLTPRERTILELLAQGTTTAGISQSLFIANTTARNHVQSIISKLGAHTRLEAVAIALRENILDRP
jgi:DNA-binding NarL/FixJ family response regulator